MQSTTIIASLWKARLHGVDRYNTDGFHSVLSTILSGGIAGFGHSFGPPVDCDTRRGTGKSGGWQ